MVIDIFRQCYSDRLKALKAISERDVDALESSADEFTLNASIYGRNMPGAELEGFAEALRCLALQIKWLNAIRKAEPESDRFQNAAKLRANEYQDLIANRDNTVFDEIVLEVGAVKTPEDLEIVEKRLSSTPLPFSTKAPKNSPMVRAAGESQKERKRPEIAFVRFDINGKPAKTLDTLAPNVAHDMLLHLRVSNWPENAERLLVEPVSAEPPDCYMLPKFEIHPPDNLAGPITFEHEGRLILKLVQPIGAKPFEFKYRAIFDPGDTGYIDLIGHRTLKLESLDPTGRALSGYENIDKKILEIRHTLKSIPGLPDSDLIIITRLLSGVGSIAGQALQDAVFPKGMKEKEFQKEALKMLRARPDIGTDLDEHPAAGGGFTDLSLDKIRLELKAESDYKPTEEQLSKYADQTAQYVVSSGKRVGILCVLDSRAKKSPPVPADSLFTIQEKGMGTDTVMIVTVIIQGGLALPSDLSR
ncbi:MAG: hypothetical protein OEY59_07035 [Deltaproteobacteria bacterium]|nr:hypothetical protein [Deltaproteobacteria bacterium]